MSIAESLYCVAGNRSISVMASTTQSSYGSSSPIASWQYNLNGGAYVDTNSVKIPFTITGLTNGTAYTVLLRAKLANGTITGNVAPAAANYNKATPFACSQPDATLSQISLNGLSAVTFDPNTIYYLINNRLDKLLCYLPEATSSYVLFPNLTPSLFLNASITIHMRLSFQSSSPSNMTWFSAKNSLTEDSATDYNSLMLSFVSGKNVWTYTQRVANTNLLNVVGTSNRTVNGGSIPYIQAGISNFSAATTNNFPNNNGSVYTTLPASQKIMPFPYANGDLGLPVDVFFVFDFLNENLNVRVSVIGQSHVSAANTGLSGIASANAPYNSITSRNAFKNCSVFSIGLPSRGGPSANTGMVIHKVGVYRNTLTATEMASINGFDNASTVALLTTFAAPTINSVTAGNEILTVTFTTTMTSVTHVLYQLNGTGSFLTASGTTGPIAITGLINGTSYTVILKVANATQGTSAASTASAAATPVAPAAPVITSVAPTNQSLIVSFTTTMTSIISIKYQLNGTGGFVTATGTTSPITITGLTNGTNYTVELQTVNAALGTSATSTASTAVAPAAPAAPVITSVAPTNQSLIVSFTTTMTSITSIKYQLNGTGGFVTATGTTSPITISGLTNGTNYTVEVQTVNAALGTSATSTASAAVAPNQPAAPVITTVSPGNAFLNVAFTTTMTSITAIQYRLNGTGSYLTATGTTSPITITGLTNGTTYTVELQTANVAQGTSATSTASSAVSPVAPAAPVITTVSPGNGFLIIAFTTTMMNVTSIKYQLNGTGGFVTAVGTSSPITITGLTNGTNYTVELQTINVNNGTSATSTASSAVSPAIPAAPVITTVSPGNGFLNVAFTTTMTNITSLLYRLNGSGGFVTATGTTSPILITGLANGTNYTVQLQTANANNGTSASSTASVAVAPVIPAAPVITSVSPGNGFLNIFYTTSMTSVASLQYRLNGTGSFLTATSTTSPIMITGLINGTNYTVELQTANADNGTSGTSTASAAFTPAIPVAPVITTVSPGNGFLTIAFTTTMSSITSIQYRLNGTGGFVTAVGTSSPITITGLTNGTTYTVELQTTNANNGTSGTSPLSDTVAPAIPAAPVITTVSPGNGFLKVAFTTTMLGITSIQYRLNGAGEYVTATGTSSPLTIAGLTNDSNYTVELQTINANNGTSATSTASSSVAPFMPAAPVITTVSPGNGFLNVAFTTTMSTVTAIQYRLNGTGGFLTATGTSSPITITGLTNGTNYTVELQTINDDTGTSAPSTTSSAVSPAIPAKPVITAVSPGNGFLNVAFTTTMTNVTSLLYRLNGTGAFVAAVGTSSPIVITGLTNGTTYTVELQSINADNGTSDTSTVSSAVAPAIPTKPEITSVSARDQSLRVAFTTTMTSVTTVQYRLNGTDPFLTATETTSPITITGLTNGTHYTVELQTINDNNGTSAISTASSAVAPAMPAAPILTSITSGNTFLKVAFTTTMTSITAILYRLNGTGPYLTATETTSPITITGLTNDTNYTVELQTVNDNNGTSTTSPTSTAVAPAIPAAPAITSVSPGNGFLTVAFTTTMSSITSIQYRLNGTGPFITAVGTTSPVQITGLTNGTNYTVELQTVNADNGTSGSSSSSAATAPKIPTRPTITSVKPIAGAIIVTFTKAMSSVTSVRYRLNGTGSFLDASGSTSPITITGLTNGADYTVELQTVNADNETSDTSTASATVMPSVPPAAPVVSFVSWSSVTATSTTLTLAIDYSGAYTYTYSIDGVHYIAATNATSNTLALQFTNAELVDGSSYDVTLIARNGTNGSSSTASTAVTVVAPPFTPTVVAATPNPDGTVTVSLSSNNPNANTVYRYAVTDVASNGIINGYSLSSSSSSSVLLCGLAPTRSYSVVLQAYNKQTLLTSNSSNALTFTTYAFPPQISYVRVTSTTAATVWFQNNQNNVAGAMAGYRYSCSTDPLVPSYTSLASTATSFSLTDLSASLVYYLTMTATTALGNSVPSTTVPFSLLQGTTACFGGGGGGGTTNGTTLVHNGGAGGGGSGGLASAATAGLGGGGGGADGASGTVLAGGNGGSGQVRVTLGTAAVPATPTNLVVSSVTSTSASVSFSGNGNDSLAYRVAARAQTPVPVTSGFDVSAATQTNTFGATAGTACGIAFAYQTTPNRLVFVTSASALYYASVSGTGTLDVNTQLYVVSTGQPGGALFSEALAVTPDASRLVLTIGGLVYVCNTAASLTTGAASRTFTKVGTTNTEADYLSLSNDGTRLVVSANSVLKWADYDAATGSFGAFTNTLHTGLVNVRSIGITGNKECLCYSTRYTTSGTNAVYWAAWNDSSGTYASGTVIASSAFGSGTTGTHVCVAFLGQTASAIIAQADSPVGCYLSYWAGPATGYTAFASIAT